MGMNMLLNIMGLLGVPKLRNMYISLKKCSGNAKGNVHGNLPKTMLCVYGNVGTRRGTRLGTSIRGVCTRFGEHLWEPVHMAGP